MFDFIDAWHWPQWLVFVYLFLGLTVHITKHHEPKEGTYNWISYAIFIVVFVITLIKGGFYRG